MAKPRAVQSTTTTTPAPAATQVVQLQPGELASMVAGAVAQAIQNLPSRPDAPREFLVPAGFVPITDLSVARGLGSIPPGATVALVQCEGAAVRWRDDGTAPTTTVGTLMQPGDVMTFDQRLDKLSFVQTAVGGKLNVSFYQSQ